MDIGAGGTNPCMAKRCRTHCPDPTVCSRHSLARASTRSANRNPGKQYVENLRAAGRASPRVLPWAQWKSKSKLQHDAKQLS
jgi:hypothetical protein